MRFYFVLYVRRSSQSHFYCLSLLLCRSFVSVIVVPMASASASSNSNANTHNSNSNSSSNSSGSNNGGNQLVRAMLKFLSHVDGRDKGLKLLQYSFKLWLHYYPPIPLPSGNTTLTRHATLRHAAMTCYNVTHHCCSPHGMELGDGCRVVWYGMA